MITESQHARSAQAYNLILCCIVCLIYYQTISRAMLTFSSIRPAKQILSGQVARPSEQEAM